MPYVALQLASILSKVTPLLIVDLVDVGCGYSLHKYRLAAELHRMNTEQGDDICQTGIDGIDEGEKPTLFYCTLMKKISRILDVLYIH